MLAIKPRGEKTHRPVRTWNLALVVGLACVVTGAAHVVGMDSLPSPPTPLDGLVPGATFHLEKDACGPVRTFSLEFQPDPQAVGNRSEKSILLTPAGPCSYLVLETSNPSPVATDCEAPQPSGASPGDFAVAAGDAVEPVWNNGRCQGFVPEQPQAQDAARDQNGNPIQAYWHHETPWDYGTPTGAPGDARMEGYVRVKACCNSWQTMSWAQADWHYELPEAWITSAYYDCAVNNPWWASDDWFVDDCDPVLWSPGPDQVVTHGSHGDFHLHVDSADTYYHALETGLEMDGYGGGRCVYSASGDYPSGYGLAMSCKRTQL